MEKRPFFVYGTLLPNQPNYSLWGSSIAQTEPAVYTNGRLYDLGAYPLMTDGKETIKGLLVWLKPALFDETLIKLDKLEGIGQSDVYARVQRPFDTLITQQTILAWTYLGQLPANTAIPRIASGSWADHSQHKQNRLNGWWQNPTPPTLPIDPQP